MASQTSDTSGLNNAIAAVGHQIFSYLSTGSLLCGSASPTLVNRTFHDAVFQCLAQSKTLSLSCRHLRKINDEQLIKLIRKIVEMARRSNQRQGGILEGAIGLRDVHGRQSNVSCHIKVMDLDLSRCRFIRGEGVYYCLKHMSSIRRILLSAASRLDVYHSFANGLVCDTLNCNKLEYVDFSGCSRVDPTAASSFVTVVSAVNLRHLDLSGVSAQMSDKIIGTVAYCNKLGSLSLAGSKKVTAFGVGLISYICRDTLKSLNLRGCEGVHLPKLLMATGFDILTLMNESIGNDHRAILPRNFDGDPETISTSVWFAALYKSIGGMMSSVPNDLERTIAISQRYRQEYQRLDQEMADHFSWGERREASIFGMLECLDISLIGNGRIRLEGCLATIAWLNGGRLKHVDVTGLESVMRSDLAVLACTNKLASLSASTAAPVQSEDECSLSCFFCGLQEVRELDLSCCDHWESRDGVDGVMISTLRNLRSLKLDHTKIRGRMLRSILAKSTQLLRLSIRGCSHLNSCHLTGMIEELGLIDLDCRDITMDVPLSAVREVCPHLLRLNGRSTPLGTKMLNAHESGFLWRVGTREGTGHKSKKRKRSGDDSSAYHGAVDANATTLRNCCSLLKTGFSSAKGTEQEVFACRTCFTGFGRFVCLECAKRCHHGHDVFSIGSGQGYCDCCIFSPCQCLERDFNGEALSHISVDIPIPDIFARPYEPPDRNGNA